MAIYLVIVLLVGITMFMGEVALGRYAQRSNVGAFKKVNKSYGWLGSIGLIAGFMILSFYSVVGGWVIYYIFRAIIGFYMTDPAQTEQLFTGFISNPILPILFHALFMAMTIGICYNGVQDGIEKYSNIMMPALLVIVIILSVHSLMLPGAAEGIKFYLVPDFSKVTGETFLAALGQVFFSLSLGMGSILTYGFKPTSGPGLTFVTLPAVFSGMPLGQLFGGAFFFLLFLAALTSAISLLEPLIAYMIEEHNWTRQRASLIIGGLIFLVGCLASLSMGPLNGLKIFGLVFFDLLDWISNNLPL